MFLLGFAASAAGGLSGCVQYASSDPAFPSDAQARYPVVVAPAPMTLDVYPVGGALDARSLSDLRAFAARYRRLGSGEIVILTAGGGRAATRAAEQVRRALIAGGAAGPVEITSKAPDAGALPPIRVAFMGLKAEVTRPCGRWPDDLASGSSLEGWKNEPWANFGCATQSTLAAQVDDPRDLVQARPLGPSDVVMRMRAIENVREGKEPGTNWTQTILTPIGGTFSNGSPGTQAGAPQ